MQSRIKGSVTLTVLLVALIGVALPQNGEAARKLKGSDGQAQGTDDATPTPEELEVRRLFGKAKELMEAQEKDRAVKMLESILEQYPSSRMVNNASLELGKHYLAIHEQLKALNYLNRLKALARPDQELTGPDQDLYLEGLYLMGVAYFQIRQYGNAFPLLRRITTQYPNTAWANQAYYYIGLSHFAQENWSKAIEALSLVGTSVDPNSPSAQYAEAGRRFYVKVEDADLPVMTSLGKTAKVTLQTIHGDREAVDGVPLAGAGQLAISSIPTEIGPPKPGDKVIQVTGGDRILTLYTDDMTEGGDAKATRTGEVTVVSTASLGFMLGDFESRASAAFLGQPVFVLLQDVDKDGSAAADVVAVTIVSRYKQAEDDSLTNAVKQGETGGADAAKDANYKIRDQITLKLGEQGTPPVHTGRFGGEFMVEALVEGVAPNQGDAILTCALNDEVMATYVDELHIGGDVPRTIETMIPIAGELDNRPRATQDVVFDALVRARKNLVEASAYLELARIFKSMGLAKGARDKAAEGIDRADSVIRTREAIPTSLKQEAFKTKWELNLESDDLSAALATCNLFSRMFPDSPIIDQALMGIGNVRMANKDYTEAVTVFRQVLSLKISESKGEAQFRIAEATEAKSSTAGRKNTGIPAAAIEEYKRCAERYPESPFAGQALARLVDYFVDQKDFGQASSLLEQTFQDYPDAAFLDSMLLKWVLVAYRQGDYAKARDKCAQLIFGYPDSPYAAKAKQILPKIEGQLKQGASSAAPEKSKEP
jgi:TolA-binding protein